MRNTYWFWNNKALFLRLISYISTRWVPSMSWSSFRLEIVLIRVLTVLCLWLNLALLNPWGTLYFEIGFCRSWRFNSWIMLMRIAYDVYIWAKILETLLSNYLWVESLLCIKTSFNEIISWIHITSASAGTTHQSSLILSRIQMLRFSLISISCISCRLLIFISRVSCRGTPSRDLAHSIKEWILAILCIIASISSGILLSILSWQWSIYRNLYLFGFLGISNTWCFDLKILHFFISSSLYC